MMMMMNRAKLKLSTITENESSAEYHHTWNKTVKLILEQEKKKEKISHVDNINTFFNHTN